jgi:hypothetical protein
MSGPAISPLAAGLITEFAGGTLHNSSTVYIGQSFFTPAGGPWNNVAFNFLADSTPFATGTAFLLSQHLSWSGCCDPPPVYTPQMLDSAAPGFIAMSMGISNGQYVFASSVTLQPSTEYYLYVNALIPFHTVSGGADLSGPGGCCDAFFASNGSSPYFPGFGSANFQLSSLTVQEPGTTGLMLLALLLLGFLAFTGERSKALLR